MVLATIKQSSTALLGTRARHRRQRWRPLRVTFALASAVLLVFGLTDTLLTQVRLHHAEVRLTVTKQAEIATSQHIAHAERALQRLTATKVADTSTDTQLRGELSGAQSRLTQAIQGHNIENFSLATVNACLHGVQTAVAAISSGSHPAALSALQNAAVPCEMVQEGENLGGPVFPYDFPDPDVIEVGGTYFAYGTNAASGNVQILQSSNLAQWSLVGDALPHLASWALPGYTWAPGVIEAGGTFLLYYTVSTSTSECISVATSSQPQGPFDDVSNGPLVCQPSLGGSIDPAPYFNSSGQLYLSWKSNGGSDGHLATIWAEQLAPSGTAMAEASAPVALLQPSQPWETMVVEGPSMWDDQGTYYLFYSGNNWQTASYAEGVAVCSGPLGPCVKPLNGPILTSQAAFSGPGGGSVFTNSLGQPEIAFHGWLPDAVGPPNPRLLFIRALGVSGGVPFVGGPG